MGAGHEPDSHRKLLSCNQTWQDAPVTLALWRLRQEIRNVSLAWITEWDLVYPHPPPSLTLFPTFTTLPEDFLLYSVCKPFPDSGGHIRVSLSPIVFFTAPPNILKNWSLTPSVAYTSVITSHSSWFSLAQWLIGLGIIVKPQPTNQKTSCNWPLNSGSRNLFSHSLSGI